MGNGVGAYRVGDLDLALGDQWPGDRRAEKIQPLVHRVGAEHGKDIIANEVLAQVFDKYLAHAGHLRFGPRRLQLLALAEVGGEGDDLAGVCLLQPFEDDRRIEPARVGENHFLDWRCHGAGRGGKRRAEYRRCDRPGKAARRFTAAPPGGGGGARRRARHHVSSSGGCPHSANSEMRRPYIITILTKGTKFKSTHQPEYPARCKMRTGSQIGDSHEHHDKRQGDDLPD